LLKNISYFAFANSAVFLLKFLSIPVVTRFTTPEDFGVIAFFTLISGFTSVVFGKSGLSASLTSRFDVSLTAWSTALFFNLCIGGVIYVLLFFISGNVITDLSLYVSELVFLLFFLVIPLNFVNDILSSRLHLAGLYRLESVVTIFTEFSGMLSCLILVFNGYAIEGLVAQHLIAASLKNIILAFYSTQYFGLNFSSNVLRENFSFSMVTTSAEIVNYLIFYLPQMIIGKFFGLSLLGSYSIFNRFTSIPSDIVQSAIYKVVIVEGAKSRKLSNQNINNANTAETMFTWSLSVYNISVVPCLLFAAVFFQPLVLLVGGEQYQDFSYVMLALALLRSSTIVVSGVNPLLKSLGRVSQLLVLYLLKLLLVISSLVAAVWFEHFLLLLILLQFAHFICIPFFVYAVASELGSTLEKVIAELRFFILIYFVAVFFGIFNYLMEPAPTILMFEFVCCLSIFILGQIFLIPDYKGCRNFAEFIHGFVKRLKNE